MPNLNRLPLSAFDPRLRSLIERGCREMVDVPCESEKRAQHLRNTLTMYRARLKRERKEHPAEWEPLYGTIIAVKKSSPTVVTLRPRLAEFDSILMNLDLPKAETAPAELEYDPLLNLVPPKDDSDAG